MFTDAPDLTFIVLDDLFQKLCSHASYFVKKFDKFDVLGFVVGEKEVFLDGNKIHYSDGEVFSGGEVKTFLFCDFVDFGKQGFVIIYFHFTKSTRDKPDYDGRTPEIYILCYPAFILFIPACLFYNKFELKRKLSDYNIQYNT